jgi:hypothetical protein
VKSYGERALEILELTNDGDDLTPYELKTVERAVNNLPDFTDDVKVAFESLYERVVK